MNKVQFYTSYWGNPQLQHLTANSPFMVIQISNSVPKSNHIDGILEAAKPEWRIVDKVKHDHDEHYYYQEYYKALKANRQKIANGLVNIYHEAQRLNKSTIVLCCYEKPNDFCHRHIFANFCNRNFNNVNIIELQ